MKKKSIAQTKTDREIETLKTMPDSEIDYTDIPRQDPNDPKWRKAVVGRFYRPIKQPIALRLDADLIAWLKSKGPGYQSRINEIIRKQMMADRKRA